MIIPSQYPAAYEGAAALTAVHGTEYTVRLKKVN